VIFQNATLTGAQEYEGTLPWVWSYARCWCGGIVAEWFIATDSPNFSVVQAVLAIFVFVAVVGVVALWPRRAR
jgi:hypothetical protein